MAPTVPTTLELVDDSNSHTSEIKDNLKSCRGIEHIRDKQTPSSFLALSDMYSSVESGEKEIKLP